MPNKSWVEVPEEHHFPIQNLPFGVFSDDVEPDRIGVRIGDFVADLQYLASQGLIDGEMVPFTNVLDELVLSEVGELRRQVALLLDEANPTLRDDERVREKALIPISRVQMLRPFSLGAFVDFYSSEQHATNVGRMFRPQGEPLLPNWKHIPIGYNGRASTVMVSEIPIVRPNGQTKPANADAPVFGPTKELDFELEVGFFLGESSKIAQPISTQDAEQYIFGLVLVNDWSARDVQRWEYQPLGPFLAKSFATSISPWVVTLEALEPFLAEGPVQDPPPLPYLRTTESWHYDIHLEVALQTAQMSRPQVISRTNYRNLYWSMAQQLAHQTCNGTHVQTGDLYASGTISGTEPGSYGSMLELAWKGERPLVMQETGEERAFIEDGDTVIMTGWCQGDGYRVGFGELRTTVLPDVQAWYDFWQ